MQSLRDWGVSELAEAERRVPEINTLIERQRQLIEELERDGHDLTSAKIIFDSLRVSLSLYIHDRHRVRCHVEPEQPEMVLTAQTPATCTAGNCEPGQSKISRSALEPKPVFDVVPPVALHGETPMPTDTVLKVLTQLDTDEIMGHRHETPAVPDDSFQKRPADQPGDFGFRPLTEEEKKEFMDSLSAKGRKLLVGLEGKKSLSKPAAA
jgi:hypothetical protein